MDCNIYKNKIENISAEIISVGTELLLGSTINTNAAFLGRELASFGIFVRWTSVVGDNDKRLENVIKIALSRADIIVTTGGLGPTYDDLTKETIAKFLDLKLVTDKNSLNRITEYFVSNNRELTQNNLKQALIPFGSLVLDNDNGTAPGIVIEYDNKIIIMLPGPPSEMSQMFDNKLKPYLLTKYPNIKKLFSKTINIFGIGESKVESIFSDLMRNSTNPTISPYAKMGELELRVTAISDNILEADKLIHPIIEHIRAKLNENIYGINESSLQSAVVKLLEQKNKTLATAESCTGGYLGKRITEINGASKIYLGGIVAYSNDVKIQLLDVKLETLRTYGAVSEQVAKEMAKGVALKLGTDIGISTTGIAGNTNDETDKPTGLVYVGYYDKKTSFNYAIELNLSRGYKDERENIRYLASSHALFEILKNNK